ncbi:hypothetical protein [Azospirillum argentinense]
MLLTTPNAILGVEEPPKMEQDEVLAAFAALDADGRTLALKLIRAMVEHQVLRES